MGLKELFSTKTKGTKNPHPKKSMRALPEITKEERQQNLNDATKLYQAMLPEKEEKKRFIIRLWKKYVLRKVEEQLVVDTTEPKDEHEVANDIYKKTMEKIEKRKRENETK